LKILLLAEEAAGLRVLRSIAKRNFELAAVVTSPAETDSLSSIENVARQAHCDVWRPEEVRDPLFGDRIREIGIDILLNVHSLYLLSAPAIKAPRIGAFNLHPGPLPQMAGLNAPSWAVYLGEKEHAVTLHWMEAGVDTGAIAYAERFPLSNQDTGLSVSNTCVKLGVPLIETLLETAARDESAITSHPQDLSLRLVFRRHDLPNGGRIDWADSARRIAAFIRAGDYGPFPSPWGHPKTRAGEVELGIVSGVEIGEHSKATPGTVLSASSDGVNVASGNGIIRIQTVQKAGRRLDACDVLHEGQMLE
jgi:methionyl-tRNA formyltransferase